MTMHALTFAPHCSFLPNRRAALRRAEQINPDLYARTRNYVDGAVTGLSPWITHGFLNLPEVTQLIDARHKLSFDDKLVFEFGWREFFLHVHGHLGQGILKDVRRPVWSGHYSQEMPSDVVEGRTGIAPIDFGIEQLYTTGYIHNHVRMWIASYLVHLRKVHWRVGADWMYGHLLDGDLASNHLSWQWVAGTFSHKPYVFNAENVAKFARNCRCEGTALDCGYEDLEALARSRKDVGPEPGAPKAGLIVPGWVDTRPESLAAVIKGNSNLMVHVLEHAGALDVAMQALTLATQETKRVVWVHPWDLGRCETETDAVRIGLIDAAFHDAHPWNDLRWSFVVQAMRQHCDAVWVVNSAKPASLSACRKALEQLSRAQDCSHEMLSTLNPGYNTLPVLLNLTEIPQPRLLPEPSSFQASFSRFYREACLLAGDLESLLGATEGDGARDGWA